MKRVKEWKLAHKEAWDLALQRTKKKADNEQEPTFVTIC